VKAEIQTNPNVDFVRQWFQERWTTSRRSHSIERPGIT